MSFIKNTLGLSKRKDENDSEENEIDLSSNLTWIEYPKPNLPDPKLITIWDFRDKDSPWMKWQSSV